MVTIDASTDRRDGVTLVTATVADASAPTRVTIESRLDGPLWPPRRQGEPAAGWSTDGFEGVVPATGTLAIGFASPAAPVEPPLALVDTAPVAGSDDGMESPRAVLRGLGDPSPPSVIDPEVDASAGPATNGTTGAQSRGEDGDATVRPTDRDGHDRESAADASQTDTGELPPRFAEWLSTVEERVRRAEALEPDAEVDAAIEELAACGGVDGVENLERQLSADVAVLERLQWRAGTLAERADRASPATAALDRLS